jgi:type IV secretion system protein VirD4
MLWALDEVANIAPIHDLPALVSQAGGQRPQVMVGLQDLSQARSRWGR